MYEAGHEVACHTLSHKRLAGEPRAFVEAEVLEGRRQLVRCGVPQHAIAGFRAPFLSVDPQLRRVLHAGGFQYDRCGTALGGRGQASLPKHRVGQRQRPAAHTPCLPPSLLLPPLQLPGGRGSRGVWGAPLAL